MDALSRSPISDTPVPDAPAPDTPAGTVIEGEFLVLDGRTGPAGVLPGTCQAPPHASSRGMDALRREALAQPAPFGRRGGWGFWLGGLCLAAASFWVSGGHAWFLAGARAEPALALDLLGSGTRVEEGRTVLHVEAEARNEGARARALPPLSILITTGKGAAMRYQVAAPPDGIGPGGRQRFLTRLPVPEDGVRAVSVAFAQ